MFQQIQKHVVNKRWRLDGIIGQGGFGTVYIATDLKTTEVVAVKLQTLPATSSPSQMDNLESEAFYYNLLYKCQGIATFHEHGRQDTYEYMVYELLGASLQTLFYRCGEKFSLKTTLMLADQLLQRLETFHSLNILHRDIKPDNFAMGFGKEKGKTVYMLDFGLVGDYTRDKKVAIAPSYAFCGTYVWAPITADLERAQSPKDDLESLAYMLIYFARGSLPWQGSADENENTNALRTRVTRDKLALPIDLICKGLPSAFSRHLKYVRWLGYNHEPNYTKLRAMYRRLMNRLGYQYDGVFDWDSLEDSSSDGVQQYKPLPVDPELTLVHDSLPMENMKEEDKDYKLAAKKLRGRPKKAEPRAKKVKQEQEEQEEDAKQQNKEPVKAPPRKTRIIFTKKKKSESPPPRSKLAQVEKKLKKKKVIARKTAANKVVVKKVPAKKPLARA
ncbi:casein kinase 1 [Trichoderma compactum]